MIKKNNNNNNRERAQKRVDVLKENSCSVARNARLCQYCTVLMCVIPPTMCCWVF